jgi:hypothetical protein
VIDAKAVSRAVPKSVLKAVCYLPLSLVSTVEYLEEGWSI